MPKSLAPERSPPRTAIPDPALGGVGDGAVTVELACQIVGYRRRTKSLKLAGFASDLAERSCLVAKCLPLERPGDRSFTLSDGALGSDLATVRAAPDQ